MMKKILICAVVLCLLAPAAAFAATEFSLGGFIKLDTYYDSSQQAMTLEYPVNRTNDPNFNHGNLRFTAQGSRFNFTIKGPEVLGAKLTGFLEMDFEQTTDTSTAATQGYTPRLRNAMFRMNWPCDTELIFGQYWTLLCDYFPESTEDSPYRTTGAPNERIPQIRLTQKFAGDWTAAGLVGEALAGDSILGTNPYSGFPSVPTGTVNGGDAETPQVQGQIKYAHDWWGKAAYYGIPLPFTAAVTAAWQRNVIRSGDVSASSLNGTVINESVFVNHTYVSPWMMQGSLFIPVISTCDANLAGTAHLLFEPWVGQGVNAFGMDGDQAATLKFDNNLDKLLSFDEELSKRYGGYVEGQYYIDNQWFVNASVAFTKVYDIKNFNDYLYTSPTSSSTGPSTTSGNLAAQIREQKQAELTLWYRPVAALKFGLEYAFVQSEYLTDAYPNGDIAGTPGQRGDLSRLGNEHRVEFVGIFYF
ncbi:MAG: hypothetical protein ABSA09_04550 [Desulfobaccales bacterium]|jgi:opacity protein-like surface antigen